MIRRPRSSTLFPYTPLFRSCDVRAFVGGGRVLGAIERSAPAPAWKTNLARGGRARAVTLAPERAELAGTAGRGGGGGGARGGPPPPPPGPGVGGGGEGDPRQRGPRKRTF